MPYANDPSGLKLKAYKKEYAQSEKCKAARKLYSETHRAERRAASRAVAVETRNRALDVHGRRCCKCGFDDVCALQFDHINGGGSKERAAGIRGGKTLALDVLAHPTKYQLLCANCNWIKRHTNHETLKPWKNLPIDLEDGTGVFLCEDGNRMIAEQ